MSRFGIYINLLFLQSMVYGNLNPQSATGKMMTRSPDTGEYRVYGEFNPLVMLLLEMAMM